MANDAVRGTVELQGEVFRKGISKVPLTSGMTILDAHQNGKGVALLQEMARTPHCCQTGEFSIALDTGIPCESKPDERRSVFRARGRKA